MIKYQDFVSESAEIYGERLELVMERISQIAEEPSVSETFKDYFRAAAAYQLNQYEIWKKAFAGDLRSMTADEGRQMNESLYGEFTPENYRTSWANYAWLAEKLEPAFDKKDDSVKCAQILGALYAALKGNNVQLSKGACRNLCIYAELFVEVYTYFEENAQIPLPQVQECMRSFMHDYSELFLENNVCSLLDPEFSEEGVMTLEADLSDDAYLYRFGRYISDNERQTHAFLASLPEEEIQAMADTMSEGYRIGFTVMNKDISKKKIVELIYPHGFERMITVVYDNFKKIGMECIFSPYSTSVNKQMDYDHKEDSALWTDKEITEYRIECYRNALEKYKDTAPLYGGPDVIEIFGETPFEPEGNPANPRFDQAQQKLSVYYRSNSSQLINKYIHGEERSFSIIAYPVASIGENYQEIFAETVKINTLDYMVYRNIQQKIIDVLDTADYVHVVGTNGNRTDMYVNLWKLKNPAKETIFENCVADVNIPLGEVFTSPVLEGTHGKLHVTQVYLEEYNYKNLELDFVDGMITDYNCTNFESDEKNKKYIQNNILFHHPTLPIGEFAIGTNTEAYRMGRVYDIQDKLPILIAEKTGPHFAVGDTCYAYEEDSMNYNPDGKAVVARENSVSALRHTDVSRAYLNCHTDITIPYDELGAITAVRKDGSTQDIIRNGRFVVPGSELLNEPLDRMEREQKSGMQ